MSSNLYLSSIKVSKELQAILVCKGIANQKILTNLWYQEVKVQQQRQEVVSAKVLGKAVGEEPARYQPIRSKKN